jgi:hypothetical protein
VESVEFCFGGGGRGRVSLDVSKQRLAEAAGCLELLVFLLL